MTSVVSVCGDEATVVGGSSGCAEDTGELTTMTESVFGALTKS